MKMALPRENDKFSAMTLKPVSGPIGLRNRPKKPKIKSIAHENGLKTRKQQVFSMTLKPVSVPIGLANRFRTPKPWAIAHENGPKT